MRFVSGVVPADADLACVEHLAQFIADQIDDGLEVQFGGQPLLDAVDDRQFGGAVFGDCSGVGFVEERAFSSATLMLVARVCKRRRSESVKAFSRSTFCR